MLIEYLGNLAEIPYLCLLWKYLQERILVVVAPHYFFLSLKML